MDYAGPEVEVFRSTIHTALQGAGRMTVGPFMACASFGVHRTEKLYTVKETAEIVFGGKSERFIRDLIRHGQIEVFNIAVDPNGRPEFMISEKSIDAFLERRKLIAAEPALLPVLKPIRKSNQHPETDGFYSTIRAHLEKRR